jgi:ubiquinone/menaquinone biosynthesis C-methylase UbiE
MPERSLLRRAYDATYGRAFAALYDRSLAKANRGRLGAGRAELVGLASGRTLELGAGTGLNLEHYSEAVSELVLTEPFGPMAGQLRERLADSGRDAEVFEAPAEDLPCEDGDFDTVVSTLVLCTVDDQAATLAEVARVLAPGGRLIFYEHVRAESPRLARAQDLLHGPWFAIGHGCHCNRDTAAAIERSPLEIAELEREEMSDVPVLVKPFIRGVASRPA